MLITGEGHFAFARGQDHRVELSARVLRAVPQQTLDILSRYEVYPGSRTTPCVCYTHKVGRCENSFAIFVIASLCYNLLWGKPRHFGWGVPEPRKSCGTCLGQFQGFKVGSMFSRLPVSSPALPSKVPSIGWNEHVPGSKAPPGILLPEPDLSSRSVST
jgi:hypothetical protein